MIKLEFTTPAPSCRLPATHPSAAVISSDKTDVKRTWNEHSLYELGDDYDRVTADDWLSAPGGFR